MRMNISMSILFESTVAVNIPIVLVCAFCGAVVFAVVFNIYFRHVVVIHSLLLRIRGRLSSS